MRAVERSRERRKNMDLLNICFQGLKGLYLEDSPEMESIKDHDMPVFTLSF